jgi:hypothetical protein
MMTKEVNLGARAALMLIAMVGLMLVACASDANDVPSLNSDGAQRAEPTAVVEADPLDNEAKMMAFTQCMRDEGIELVDAGVDAEGNVQGPTLAEGVQVSREEFEKAMAGCGKHLEGLTMGRERQDVTETLDQRVALATCLREKGYDVNDPTAETLDQWGKDFRVEFDWDDPEAMAAYEECAGD